MVDRDSKSTTTGGSLDVKDAGLERIGSDRELKQGEAEGKGLEQPAGEASADGAGEGSGKASGGS